MMKKSFHIVVVLTCLTLLASCAEPHLNPPHEPQRIVSLKPNLTELLFSLGVGDRVVGVTKHCVWPEEATQLPKIGDYAFPDLEKILALKPDLVVTLTESSSPRLVAILEKAGIPVLVLQTYGFEQIFDAVLKLGATLNVANRAQELVTQLQAGFDKLRTQTKHVERKSALLVIQRHPLIIAGQTSFMNEVIEAAGARNVSPSASIAYPRLSMEEVLAWQPEVIIDIDPTSGPDEWTRYQSLPAVQQDQLLFLSPELFYPGPRILNAAEMLAHAMYPESL